MNRHRAKNRSRTSCLTACLAVAVLVGASRAGAAGVTPRRVPPRPLGGTVLSSQCRLRSATEQEWTQFYAEFARNGWQSVEIVQLPSAYGRVHGSWEPTGSREATLFGDVDGDGEQEWVLGCLFHSDPSPTTEGAQPVQPAPGQAATTGRDDRARIVILKKNAAGEWKVAWRSPGLGFRFGAPEYNLREVDRDLESESTLRLPLSLVDVDGDGRLEIAYQCWSESPSVGGLPGVYRWDGRRWVNVAPQADRFSLQDLDRDGKLEVVTGSRYIGYGMGDDDVPRVWRWSGQRYQDASSQFPAFYAALAERYTACTRRMRASGEHYDGSVWNRAIQKAESLGG